MNLNFGTGTTSFQFNPNQFDTAQQFFNKNQGTSFLDFSGSAPTNNSFDFLGNKAPTPAPANSFGIGDGINAGIGAIGAIGGFLEQKEQLDIANRGLDLQFDKFDLLKEDRANLDAASAERNAKAKAALGVK